MSKNRKNKPTSNYNDGRENMSKRRKIEEENEDEFDFREIKNQFNWRDKN